MGIIPYTCFNLNNFGIVVWCLQNYCVTLPHMSIGGRVVGSVTFQEVDDTPCAEAAANSHNENFQSVNSRSEKFHIHFLHLIKD